MVKIYFLSSAVVILYALTGLAFNVYDETTDIFNQFESDYCFSPQLQQIYTAKELEKLLLHINDCQIYRLNEPLDTCLIIFKAGSHWLLLGPYIEKSWSEHSARVLLANMGTSEALLSSYKMYYFRFPIVQRDFALKTALLIAEHMGCGRMTVKDVQIKSECIGSYLISPEYTNADADEVNRRYQLEDRFVAAVRQGDVQKAIESWKAMGKACTGIYFMTDSIHDQLAGAASGRTLIRLGAKQGGISPILIDSISQEYAQRMKQVTSKQEVARLFLEMTARMCDEVSKQQRSNRSPAVQKAVDYILVNMSKSMTVAEIARAAGIDRHQLSKDFYRETGRTVKQYLTMQRCEVAADLLLDSRASIQEIAAYVGYEDTNYFSKVFKADKGVSPQMYRASQGVR